MVDFAGWRMPVQYGDGIVAEHLWTRKRSSLFDVSHMGRFVFRGRGALPFVQHILTNDAARLSVGQSQYTIIANEAGGAVDDAYLYRFWTGGYLLVVNAANKDKDAAYFRAALAGFEHVEMIDVSDSLAMVALQGPSSEEILAGVLEVGELPAAGRNALSAAMVCATEVWLGRTGYTGEPVCFELMFPSTAAEPVWDALVGRGARPAGLGARDTLRLEAGLPLYGHEYGMDGQGREIPVFACPLARFAVSFDEAKGDFVGRAVLGRQREALERLEAKDASGLEALPRRIRQIAVTGRGVARQGAHVMRAGRVAGVITSGTMAPYWKAADTCEGVELTDESGLRAVAMGLIDSRMGVGDEVAIDIRGKAVAARVVRRNLNSASGRYAIPLLYSE
jgi:aminomethyltransferase